MKTPRKQFNELPLPEGWKTPPEGWLFIGMDKDLPRDKEAKVMACPGNGNGWYGPESYLSCAGSPLLAIAAPAHLVRKLSTQKRAARKVAAVTEPRLPCPPELVGKLFRLPLPEGMPKEPKGYAYVGTGKGRSGHINSLMISFRKGPWQSGSWAMGETDDQHFCVPEHWLSEPAASEPRKHCPPELVGKLIRIPLPYGMTPPPKGFAFVGDPVFLKEDTKFDGVAYMGRGGSEWNVGRYFLGSGNCGNIAVPDHWLSEPAVTEPRKPYDEKPLPVGIAQPPDGFVYVGMGVVKINAGQIWFHNHVGRWVDDAEACQGGYPDHHYAAPAELCNRIPSPPESQRVIAAPPKQAEPVKGRFDVARGGICVAAFDTADQAYERAEQIARDNPKEIVYVYQLRALFTASVNVNRTDY